VIGVKAVADTALSLVDRCGASVLRPLQKRLQPELSLPSIRLHPVQFSGDLLAPSALRKTGSRSVQPPDDDSSAKSATRWQPCI